MAATNPIIREIEQEIVNDDIVTKEAVVEITKRLIKSGYMKNVAIFIDFDNIYYTLRDYGADIRDGNYNICKFLAETYNTNITRKFRAYADFQQVDVNLTKLQELRIQIRHVYGNSKEERFRKNASDIELSLDAIETYYKNPDIDTYIFVTCDSDMIPIMSRLKYKGKQVHLFYIGGNISQEQHITSYADVAYDIIEIFQIDQEANKPEKWVDKSLEIIAFGCDKSQHKGKYYGIPYALKDIEEGCGVSRKLADKILELLVEEERIIKYQVDSGAIAYKLPELNDETMDNTQSKNLTTE